MKKFNKLKMFKYAGALSLVGIAGATVGAFDYIPKKENWRER